jgi:hypothetical protein
LTLLAQCQRAGEVAPDQTLPSLRIRARQPARIRSAGNVMPCRANVVVVSIALPPCHFRSETKNRLAAHKQTDRIHYIVRTFHHQKSPRCERDLVVDGRTACFLPGHRTLVISEDRSADQMHIVRGSDGKTQKRDTQFVGRAEL